MTRKWSLKTVSGIILLGMLIALACLFAARPAQAAANITVYTQNFWHTGEDLSTQTVNPYLPASFGIDFDFKTNYRSQVMLLSFLLYADEAVPDASYCETHGAIMPPAHPERRFWSPGFATKFSPGRNVYSQTYNFNSAPAGTSHLISWIIVRNNSGALTYCAQKVYPFATQGSVFAP